MIDFETLPQDWLQRKAKAVVQCNASNTLSTGLK
jgi:hypothetical protein